MQVHALEAEIFLHASHLSRTLVIKAILCGQDTKTRHACSVSHRTCIEELETRGLINMARPRVAGSRNCHTRGPRLKAGVAHAAMLRHHNCTWHHAKNATHVLNYKWTVL